MNIAPEMPSPSPSPRLSLGPVLFNWAPQRWRDFYLRIADEAPIDTVYLGETVCSKRMPFHAPHVAEVVARLQAAGKDVVLSTLALIMTPREMTLVRETVEGAEDLLVEANDVSALALLEGTPHVVGPFVNVYNEGTLRYLAEKGARRVCLPVELSCRSIAAIAADRLAELEVLAFGRLPLALSARCYHARSRNLAKDSCQFVCEDDPDGLDLRTLDDEPFLAVNGVQTLSHSYVDLSGDVEALRAAGIDGFRLSPHTCDMVAVIETFRDRLNAVLGPEEAAARIAEETGGAPTANGYLHGEPGAALRRATPSHAE